MAKGNRHQGRERDSDHAPTSTIDAEPECGISREMSDGVASTTMDLQGADSPKWSASLQKLSAQAQAQGRYMEHARLEQLMVQLGQLRVTTRSLSVDLEGDGVHIIRDILSRL